MNSLAMAASWLVGLVLGEKGILPLGWTIGAIGMAGIGLILCRRRPVWRWAFAGLLACFLGMARLLVAQPHFGATHLSTYNGRGSVVVRGVVVQRPDILGNEQTLRVRANHIAGDGFDLDIEGDLLVWLDVYPRYRYGDELALEGQLLSPPRYAGFDYRQVLAYRGMYSVMRRPQASLLARDQGSSLLAQLYRFKDAVVSVIAESLPMPQAALLSAVLMGDESGIPRDLEDDFRTTGTSHIVVISGWNVAILAGLVLAVCGPLFGRRASLWLALGVVAGYTMLVGLEPPVVRAAIMGGLTLLALLAGRQTWALHSLALAAMFMTAVHPFVLWDLGFQLSFAATLGLIVFQPPLSRMVSAFLSRLGLAGRLWLTRALTEVIVVTASAQIFVIPILAYRLRELSLITLPANCLVLPVQAPQLILGALTALGGLIWLPLGRLLGWLAWPFLTYTIRMVEWLADIPAATVPVPPLSPALLILYYGLAVLAAIMANWDASYRRQVWLRAKRILPAQAGLLGLGLGVVLTWAAALAQPDGRLHVYILDVGEGDAILIRSPAGKQILLDGGPDGPPLLAAIGRHMPFWDRSLDAVIASHEDSDHITGLFAALERYRVRWAVAPELEAGSELADLWHEMVNDHGAEPIVAVTGLAFILPDNVRLDVLHPPANAGLGLGSNDRSVVTRLSYGNVSVLFAGDLERLGEEILLAGGQPLASTVLKVAHHGAATGTSERFLEAVSPALAVISVGADNRFGHPAAATLRRLETRDIPVWRTDEAGTIELITDGSRLWVRGRR